MIGEKQGLGNQDGNIILINKKSHFRFFFFLFTSFVILKLETIKNICNSLDYIIIDISYKKWYNMQQIKGNIIIWKKISSQYQNLKHY